MRPVPGRADVALRIDSEGVIREAVFGDALAGESSSAWVGAGWAETVTLTTRPKIERLSNEALQYGVSNVRQVNHRMPSGAEVPVEYTAVRIDPDGSLMAVGRSLAVVGTLQRQLVDAQRELEADHWRLREIETRYRLLFDRAVEAILVIDIETLEVRDANPAASLLLGLQPGWLGAGDTQVTDLFDESGGARLRSDIRRAHRTARARPVHLTLRDSGRPCEARASLLMGEDQPTVLLQLSVLPMPDAPTSGALDFEEVLEKHPDPVVIAEASGEVLWMNRRFLQLIELDRNSEALGEHLSRWLGVGTWTDLRSLRSALVRGESLVDVDGYVQGEYGRAVDVRYSATGLGDGANRIAIVIRTPDVGRESDDSRPESPGGPPDRSVGE